MANATQPPGGRKPLTLVIVAIVILLVAYLAYRYSTGRGAPPVVEPTPAAAEVTATAVAAEASPTAIPAPTPTWPPATCQNWIVEVGPNPEDLSNDPICLGPQNWVRWKARTGSTGLRIFFPASGFPSSTGADVAPFLGMHRDTSGGKDEWVFNSVSEPIYSGPPNPEFGKPGQRYHIKYWQSINGRTTDGRIIIQH